MHLVKSLAALAAAALLAGCQAQPEITTPPVEMTYTQRNLPVQKYQMVAFRTFLHGENNTRQMVEGVPCKVKGGGFHGQLRSPANLRLPVMGINTSDLIITCTYEGQEIARSFGVNNFTRDRIANSGAGGGLLGVVIATSVAGARGDSPNDDYGYRDLGFMLNERPQARAASE